MALEQLREAVLSFLVPVVMGACRGLWYRSPPGAMLVSEICANTGTMRNCVTYTPILGLGDNLCDIWANAWD